MMVHNISCAVRILVINSLYVGSRSPTLYLLKDLSSGPRGMCCLCVKNRKFQNNYIDKYSYTDWVEQRQLLKEGATVMAHRRANSNHPRKGRTTNNEQRSLLGNEGEIKTLGVPHVGGFRSLLTVITRNHVYHDLKVLLGIISNIQKDDWLLFRPL